MIAARVLSVVFEVNERQALSFSSSWPGLTRPSAMLTRALRVENALIRLAASRVLGSSPRTTRGGLGLGGKSAVREP